MNTAVRYLVMAFPLVIGACAAQEAPNPAPALPLDAGPAGSNDFDTLLTDLRAIVLRDRSDCEVMLRNLAFRCWSERSEREWSEVRAVLERQGAVFEDVPATFANWPTLYTCVVQTEVFSAPTGITHDLLLRFTPAPHYSGGPEPPPDAPRFVRHADAGLRAKIGKPIRELVTDGAYPPGTVMDVWLRSEEASKIASNFPVLEELVINYGPFQWRSPEGTMIGFHVSVDCAPSHGYERASASKHYLVGSGMDAAPPWGNLGTWVVPRPGFVPSHELYGVVFIGGTESRATD